MTMVMLMAIAFVQMTMLTATKSDAREFAPSTVVHADFGEVQGASRIQDNGIGEKKLDINLNVSGAPSSGMWYSQPIWIAVFVLGGVVVLTLLTMALRGSGGAGATVVKT